MKLDSLTKEELELMSYKDISYIIIDEKGQMNTPNLFRIIADKLGMSDKEYESKIGDFYMMLTTDKRFIMIDGNWDLRSNHKSDKVIAVSDEDDDEDIEDYSKNSDENDFSEEKNDDEENYDSDNDDEFEDEDDSLNDLVIVDEDELELEQ